MKILSIDCGIEHFGYCIVEISPSFRIIEWEVRNLKNIRHVDISLQECTLNHNQYVGDFILHFIQEKKEMIEQCDIILLERQPPTSSCLNVECSIYVLFYQKCFIVSSMLVKRWAGILVGKKTTYEKKKQDSINYIYQNMTEEQLKWIKELVKKDDCTDAMVQTLFFIDVCMKKGTLKSMRAIRHHFDQHRKEFIQNEDITYITGKEKEQETFLYEMEKKTKNVKQTKEVKCDNDDIKIMNQNHENGNINLLEINKMHKNNFDHHLFYNSDNNNIIAKIKVNIFKLLNINGEKMMKVKNYKNKRKRRAKPIRLKNGSLISPYFIYN